MPTDPRVDTYLAAFPAEQRALLQGVRDRVAGLAPNATETISYGMPTFKYKGGLVAFGAFARHCSLFPMSYAVMETFKDELKNFSTSKGTIQFPMNKPLPAALVKKLVKARIAENDRKRG